MILHIWEVATLRRCLCRHADDDAHQREATFEAKLTPLVLQVSAASKPAAGLWGALLRGELVHLRSESDPIQEQVAADPKWSPSKLIRVEGGRSSITKVGLNALLDSYGVTSGGAPVNRSTC